MTRICIEHEIPLNEDGTCPKCRDSHGQPFVLDMQSYYLQPAHIRLYHKVQGGHVLVTVWSGKALATTHSLNGELIFNLEEWQTVEHALRSHPTTFQILGLDDQKDHCVLKQDVWGRWILMHPDLPFKAWTGSRWTPVSKDGTTGTPGLPIAYQVSNFETKDAARQYAESFGFTVLESGPRLLEKP